MDAIVAIMAVLKILLIPNDRNCCNYGNFEKKKCKLEIAIVAIMAILI